MWRGSSRRKRLVKEDERESNKQDDKKERGEHNEKIKKEG